MPSIQTLFTRQWLPQQNNNIHYTVSASTHNTHRLISIEWHFAQQMTANWNNKEHSNIGWAQMNGLESTVRWAFPNSQTSTVHKLYTHIDNQLVNTIDIQHSTLMKDDQTQMKFGRIATINYSRQYCTSHNTNALSVTHHFILSNESNNNIKQSSHAIGSSVIGPITAFHVSHSAIYFWNVILNLLESQIVQQSTKFVGAIALLAVCLCTTMRLLSCYSPLAGIVK